MNWYFSNMKIYLSLIILLSLISCADTAPNDAVAPLLSVTDSVVVLDKMSGVSLEMPGQRMEENKMGGIVDIGAKWVSLIPYGYTKEGESKVHFNWDGPWWGESLNGTAKCIEYAQEIGLKTLLKPHVWVVGQGWPGRFDPKTDDAWLIWETSYREYILACAELADSMEVDAFCIGTEYRVAVVERSAFWEKLIKEVRAVYKGQITYAANWDNFEKVMFWDQLDFIGIDAYFPLSKEKEPSREELENGWSTKAAELNDFSKKWNRKIAFTEYGFRSVDFMNSHSSKNEDELEPNMKNQERGYAAFFNTIWQEEWMLGGFFWKWHFYKDAGGFNNDRYTPQNKPAEKIIQHYYGAKSNEE